MAPGAAGAARLALLAVLWTLLPGELGAGAAVESGYGCVLKPWEDQPATGWE